MTRGERGRQDDKRTGGQERGGAERNDETNRKTDGREEREEHDERGGMATLRRNWMESKREKVAKFFESVAKIAESVCKFVDSC
ncbi:MAG: hypothetical protein IK066_12065 [Kiritimatiellae bacterium]|nr:hypothetical protein [Kiritimatiellia bacterium]